MGAIRFQGEFQTSTGILYTIQIFDQDHTGSISTFAIGSDGFTLSYRGENADMMNPILGSELGFDMAIADETMEAFITDIATSREGRFWIGVYKGAGGQDLFWCGVMAADIARLEDQYFPYFFTVKATDGLGALREIEYSTDDFQPFDGDERLIVIIERCLNFLPHIAYYFEQAQYFIRTSINWYEENHTYSAAYDPLYYTYADNRVTYSTQDNATWEKGATIATYKFETCYDVLRSILSIFGARIMFADGTFFIEQIETRAEAVFYSRYYGYPTATPIADNLMGTYNITPGSTRRKLNGGHFSWFPAISNAELTYQTLNKRNYMPPVQFQGDLSTFTQAISPFLAAGGITIKATGVNYLNISGAFRMTIEPFAHVSDPLLPLQLYCIHFGIFIVLNGTTDYYLERRFAPSIPGNPYSISYQATKWSTTPLASVRVASPFFNLPGASSAPVTLDVPFNIVSPALPADGELTVFMTPRFIYGPSSVPTFPPGGFVVELIDELKGGYDWNVRNPFIQLVQGGLADAESNAVKYIAVNPTPGNTTNYKNAVLWADGTTANTFGRLKALVSGSFVDTENWGFNTVSGTSIIQRFLLERIIKLQQNPTQKMYTSIYGTDFSIWKTVNDSDGTKWLFLGGEYTANKDEWQGEWFAVSVRPASGIVFEEIPSDDFPGGPPLPPGPTSPGSTESVPGSGLAPATLGPLSSAETIDILPAGPVSSIALIQTLAEDAFISGEKLILYDPGTGYSEIVTVTAGVDAGDTSIGVTGTLAESFSIGSYLIRTPKNDTEFGGVGPPGGGGGGTVTSVGLALPSIFSVSGSPVTGSGTLTGALVNQNANLAFAGPTGGGPAAPSFRALVAADIPSLDTAKITSGTFAVARGGTGLSSLGSALQVLRVNAGGTALEFATPTSGTVTSVGLSLPSIFSVSGSPITGSGTLTGTLATQNANLVFAGPGAGSPAAPTFRALVAADIPALSALSGTLNYSQLSNTGADADEVLRYTGSAWAASPDKWTTSGSDIYRNSGVTVGGTNITLAKLNVEGMTAGVGARISPGAMSVGNTALTIAGTATTEVYGIYCDMGVVGSNLVWRIRNNNNSNANSGALMEISSRVSGGDPAVRLTIEGGNFWQMTTDNSDSDAFVISYNTGPNANQPLKINSTGVTIIRQLATPVASLTVTPLAAAGTGASASTLGGECFFWLLLTTGTSPGRGQLFTVTLPRAVPTTLVPVFCAANNNAAAEINKFYWASSGGSTFTISVDAPLSASTNYYLNFFVGGS